MKNSSGVWLSLCCFSLVIINLLLVTYILIHEGDGKIFSKFGNSNDQNHELSWTRKAAKEAEIAASISCSGHGRAYLDGLLSTSIEGENQGIGDIPLPSCECNSCYYGSDCSQFSPECPADANSGDPLFLEPFWVKHAEGSAILVAGWHRMSYVIGYPHENTTLYSKELERHIRKLHAMVGNANTTGRFMIFGAGATQLLNAAVYALSPQGSHQPITKIVATAPFYWVYKSQTELFNSKTFNWEGFTTNWKNASLSSEYNNSSAAVNFIEFVTSPNNPDGELKDPVLTQGPFVKTIYDYAYYWPIYTAIPAPVNEDLMIFSLSKLTGHGGTRFGWALIKDEAVYKRFLSYMIDSSFGVSRETQLKSLKLLKVVLSNGKEFFEFGHKTLKTKWERLNKIVSVSKRFSLQKLVPQYSTYCQKITPPSPGYAWVKCEREEDENCYETLRRDGGIIGRAGSEFGAENRYVRLSLIKNQDDFEWLLKRMSTLVSREKLATQSHGRKNRQIFVEVER